MIRITIELVPDENEPLSRILGYAEIATMKTVGDASDYQATVHFDGKKSTTIVRGQKSARSVWSILHSVLEQLKFHPVMDKL